MDKSKEIDIKKIRAKLGLSQEQFAARVGVSFYTVYRWENGKAKPSQMARKAIKNLIAEIEE